MRFTSPFVSIHTLMEVNHRSENLIELKTNEAKDAPNDWVKSSKTKAAVRFHSPKVLKM